MSTAAQLTANSANAQLSTGPRTEPGKHRSCQNSLKHGLTAKTVLIPGEDPAEYQAFAEGMQQDLAAVSTIECALAQELIDLQWRLLRVSRLEARILSADSPDFKALNNLGLHASRMKRQYSASLHDFVGLKTARVRARQSVMETAATLRRADIIHQRPTDLTQFGFVFNLDEIDASIREEDALVAARGTIAAARPGGRNRIL